MRDRFAQQSAHSSGVGLDRVPRQRTKRGGESQASRTRGGTSAPERAASPPAAPPFGGPWAGSAGALPTCAPSSHTCSPAPRR